MKRQKGFDWYKFVTISMVVIGVGFLLISLIFSRIVFNNEELSSEKNLAADKVTTFDGNSKKGKTQSPKEEKHHFAQVSEGLTRSLNEESISASSEEAVHTALEGSDSPSDSSSKEQSSMQSDTPAVDEGGQALKTEITQMLFDYKDIIDTLAELGRDPNHDSRVVERYIVARRETGHQIMLKSMEYMSLTGDRGATLPGGWIYEFGKTVGFEIRHEHE